MLGDDGPDSNVSEVLRDTEADFGKSGEARACRFGEEGFRGGGCCRIRRRPVSRSAVKMGDLRGVGSNQ